jgi:hypothetical protein
MQREVMRSDVRQVSWKEYLEILEFVIAADSLSTRYQLSNPSRCPAWWDTAIQLY